MPGQLKEVRNRIKSVQSTQQITKAMKMVSAAKLRKAQDSIIQMRPYAQKLQDMLSNIVSNSDGDVSGTYCKQSPDHFGYQRPWIVWRLQCQPGKIGQSYSA
jgi:F-type H+-transporting ATPase subunit gamma